MDTPVMQKLKKPRNQNHLILTFTNNTLFTLEQKQVTVQWEI